MTTGAAALLAIVVNLATGNNHPMIWWALGLPVAVFIGAAVEWWKERDTHSDTVPHPDPIIDHLGGGDFIPLRSPDVPARAGADAYNHQRFQEAFGLYVRALDRLHTLYSIDDMRIRQPGTQDAWILNGLVSSLGAAQSLNPHLDVRNDHHEAEARLTGIIRDGTRVGIDMQLYRATLAELGRYRYQAPTG